MLWNKSDFSYIRIQPLFKQYLWYVSVKIHPFQDRFLAKIIIFVMSITIKILDKSIWDFFYWNDKQTLTPTPLPHTKIEPTLNLFRACFRTFQALFIFFIPLENFSALDLEKIHVQRKINRSNSSWNIDFSEEFFLDEVVYIEKIYEKDSDDYS